MSEGVARGRGRALCGWSPSPLPARTAAQRLLDRVLLPTTTWCAVVATVTLLFNLATRVPARAALSFDGVAVMLAGAVCAANFWRCRHAHCLVTGGGWVVLGVIAFVGAAIGHSLIGGWEQVVFVAILIASLIFEGGWYLARGTNALGARTGPTGRPSTRRENGRGC